MKPGDRFSRQRLLREVGSSGQALIERTELRLPHEAGEAVAKMASLYGCAAGLLPGASDTPRSLSSVACEATFQFESSREVGLGAFLALEQIMNLLSTDAPSPDSLEIE